MRPGRRRRAAPPAPGRDDLTVLVATDLHADFAGAGPMAAPGADRVADGLVELVAAYRAPQLAFQHAASRGGPSPAPVWSRAAAVVVEGPGPHAGAPSPYPDHAGRLPEEGLLAGIELAADCPWAWAGCPAAGADPLDATWNARDRLVRLRADLAAIRPGRVEVVGLSLDHGGLPLTESLVADPQLAGLDVTVLAGRSSFLDLDACRPRLDRLAGAGVHVDWGRP